MSDLISREALLEKVQGHHDFFVNAWGGFGNLSPADRARVDEISNCIAEIVNAPAVEAEPVKHCPWCEPGDETCGTCKKFFDYNDDGGSDRCSGECLMERCSGYEPMPFCPNCGAKMDGGTEHE